MQALNLTGVIPPQNKVGVDVPVANSKAECFLRPFNENGQNYLDAQILPKTKIEAGDQVFFTYNKENLPILKTVKEVVERRPARGDWSKQPVHCDWVRLLLA